ncbi:MAG TPA: OsmC family peroxiredoxin [Gaiellaceae bacterium]|jgi:osmotically inducible protein OsmC|nr:OsmC family peroxiredoxin [Gaiellaceae bacterium]
MPIATRNAEVTWDGSLARGGGLLSSGSHALQNLPVTWAARTEGPEGKTSPEELIAAAHATCFTMALALVLGEADTPPERLTTSADCVLTEVDGAPRITELALRVRAHVRSTDEVAFNDAVANAAALCPVSNALRGNVEISIDAALEA